MYYRILSCLVAPVTPNMIVLTQGDQYLYFSALSVFLFIAGGLMIALFSNLQDEMSARSYLSGQPSLLGHISYED